MRGFLRREWYLMAPNLRFYALVVAVMLAVSCFSPGAGSFVPIYLMAFGSSSVLNLFYNDEAKGWYAYAAAVPGGRKRVVEARYVTAFITALVTMVLTALATMAGGDGQGLWTVSLYGSVALLSLSVALPATYRFGGFKARIITLVVTFGLAGGAAAVALAALWEKAPLDRYLTGGRGFSAGVILAMPLVSLGIFALSWRLSRNIMLKKEF